MWALVMAITMIVQILYMVKAFEGKNYWEIKSSGVDIMISVFVLGIMGMGGVAAFQGAVIATFILTVYLKVMKKKEIRPQPKWWLIITGQKKIKL